MVSGSSSWRLSWFLVPATAPTPPQASGSFLFLEGLEIRINPAVFNVVAATADGATGSLRDAIDQSDTNGDASNTINLAAGTYSADRYGRRGSADR